MVSEDELAPLTALIRAAERTLDWARSVQMANEATHEIPETHKAVGVSYLRDELTTLKAAIARAEDALG